MDGVREGERLPGRLLLLGHDLGAEARADADELVALVAAHPALHFDLDSEQIE